jgi:hypothetical protein
VLQHGACIGEQIAVGEFLREVGDRPADVGLDELEQVGDRRREAPHAKLRIEEHHGDVGAAQQIGDVVRRRLELHDLRLQLVIDRDQLFVDRTAVLPCWSRALRSRFAAPRSSTVASSCAALSSSLVAS